MNSGVLNEALMGHYERMVTYRKRYQRIRTSWLGELDEFYNIMMLYRMALVESGALDALSDCAGRMLKLTTQEDEVFALIEASEEKVQEIAGAI